MFKVDSKIVIDRRYLDKISDAAIKAAKKTGEALKTEVIQAQVVPFDKGTLQGEGFFVDEKLSHLGVVSLVHNTPYARRLYFHPEYDFQTKENPYARGEWFEDWLPGGDKADFAPKTFAAFLKREGDL